MTHFKRASLPVLCLLALVLCSCGVGKAAGRDLTGAQLAAADKGLDVAFAHNMYEGRDGMSLEEQVAALVQGAPEEYGQPDYIVAVSDDLSMENLPFDYQARLLEWKDAGKLPEYTVEGKPRYFVPDDLAKALWEPETNH